MSALSLPPPDRRFAPFLDPIDGTLCIPASANAEDIRVQAAPHCLRFPLILDANASLLDQVESSGFAPASSRFGPYCDNILGMNWRMPDGRVVRIGERVVKTTTGYDWLRFLLHSGTRYGQPLDYVLRLRPDCGTTGWFLMTGPEDRVHLAAMLLLRNSWMHWFDAVDIIAAAGVSTLRVTVHCPAGEWTVFENHLATFAKTQHLSLEIQRDTAMPSDGCPDAVFKTTPEHVGKLATELARTDGVHCVAPCYPGVVHAYLPNVEDRAEVVRLLAEPHIRALHALGGDWHSRHLPACATGPIEEKWIAKLQQASSPA